MQVNFYRKINSLSKKWRSNLQKFLDEIATEKVLVLLFGSRSRKDHNLLSDYDLVIISEKEMKKPVLDFPSDLFIFTVTEALQLLNENNFIIKNALQNGEILINTITSSDILFKHANE